MIVRVRELSDEVRQTRFAVPAEALNSVMAEASGLSDARFEREIEVGAELYRRGTDVFFVGSLSAQVSLSCRRCLSRFRRRLDRPFRVLIVEARAGQEPEDDAGLDHYSGDELDLDPLVTEQAILALDEAEPCSPECRGLCAGCGANLNEESCRCSA